MQPPEPDSVPPDPDGIPSPDAAIPDPDGIPSPDAAIPEPDSPAQGIPEAIHDPDAPVMVTPLSPDGSTQPINVHDLREKEKEIELAGGHLDVLTDDAVHKRETQTGATALTVAVLVHAAILVGLAFWVVAELVESPPELTVAATQSSVDTMVDKKEFVENVKQRPSRPSAKPSNLINAMAQSNVTLPSIDLDMTTPDIGTSFGTGFGVGGFGDGGGGGMSIPAVMKGRCDAADRAKRLSQSGGDSKHDRAVLRALTWLQSKQNEDGSWGSNFPVAMTGLVLLAYSGHCETVDSPKFGETVLKAITFLVRKAEQNQGLMISTGGGTTSYEHAIATYALAEAYSLNKNARKKFPKISTMLKPAVAQILEGQTDRGGWMYAYQVSNGNDLSVAGWNIQALKAAELTGRPFTGLKTAKAKILSYLEEAAVDNGNYKYRLEGAQHQNGKDSLIGVGLLCNFMMGSEGKYARDGFKTILGKNQTGKVANPYAWYYYSQAAFQEGGSTWRDYNRKYQEVVLKTQNENGSWSGATSGHSSDRLGGDVDVYDTALCTLMLEVYYRYLPASDLKKNGSSSGLIER